MTTARSPVEHIKARSRHLRGTLADSLANAVTGALAEDDTQLIKFHGSYQQDDRDLREERRQQKLEPAYSFMIRTRTPGGVVTPAQWLALDGVAQRHANGTLKLTTRQAFQFHGVIKTELKATLQLINASLIDTIAACGDVNRNVQIAAHALDERARAIVQRDALAVAAHLLPQTRAYYELWLDEQPVATADTEPVYGDTYLPRKFKIGFALPPANDVDVFANDLGFIAIVEDGQVVGYNVSAGGGLGTTHGDARTYPRLADLLGFVPVASVVATAEAVLTAQRDLGNRSERRLARLKYTLDRLGLEAFRAEVERRQGCTFAPARPFAFDHSGDRFGWHEDADGAWHLGLRITGGRVADRADAPWRSGLRAIAQTLAERGRGGFRLTPNQNVVIAGLAATDRAVIEALVRAHRLDLHASASPLVLHALACVALPTCPLAMAEAERYLPELTNKVEALLAAHGLREVPLHLRISGCPNGCSRPYLGEIALIGKAPGRYNLLLGADRAGRRLNRLHRENIDEAGILAELDALFSRYAAARREGEDFGDFLVRCGLLGVRERIAAEVVP